MQPEANLEPMINSLDDVTAARAWKGAYGIPQAVQRIKDRLAQRLPEGQTLSLTALQKKVLNHPDFWSNRNLIIQGATSAGKTLLAELLILDVLQQEQKAIFLVPLKAMVHERTQQFKKDIEYSSYNHQVFGSSSDYMDNDERLINGGYSVAIIVYEKFFAMLNQPNCHILDDCKLIVVDELSMLSKDERGPKLETALEIARVRSPESRIVCLATCDCQTNHIASWLKTNTGPEDAPEDAVVIKSTLRPVGLDEYIILPDGTYSFRHISSEQECGGRETDKLEVLDPEGECVRDKLEVPGYRKNGKEGDQKRCLLIPVVERIYHQYPDAKVLVFVASQANTVSIANELKTKASKLFCSEQPLDEDFKRRLSACDPDEEQKKLINELLPRGIAYHNASLPTSLRELIEEEFQKKNSPIKLIVATETLTIGVNMPFDAMILMDNRVPRGIGEHKKLLTNQEYRNYIGRAGRLGQSNRPGISYLFVHDCKERNEFWNGYYQNDREVGSALTGVSEVKHAPYYLGLLIDYSRNRSTDFNAEKLDQLHASSLSRISNPRSKFSAPAMMSAMEDSRLVRCQRVMGKDKHYLLPFGISLAPYALSLDTCDRIYWYFFSGCEEGLPVGISQADLDEDKYLLEILYHICRHSEIEDSSTLIYPTKDELAYGAKGAVLKALRKLVDAKKEDGTARYSLWDSKSSELYELLHETNIPKEHDKLQAAMRAILLFYWTHGKTILEIRTITNFNLYAKIVNGDLERLAEVASFHLDAIYHCLSKAQNKDGVAILKDTSALKALYTLQVRVKYGMPRALTQLANKHVHGLDRSRILALGAEADRRGIPPIQLLYVLSKHTIAPYMTGQQHNQLLELLESRYHASRFSTLMDIMKNDLGSDLLETQMTALKTIFETQGVTAVEFRDSLKAILDNKTFTGFDNLDADHLPQLIWKQSQYQKKFHIGLLFDSLPTQSLVELAEFIRNSQREHTCFVIFDSDEALNRYKACGGTYYLAMDREFFALILANTLLLQQNSGEALAEFFQDARGCFKAEHYQEVTLGNYIPRAEEKDPQPSAAPVYRLICNRSPQRQTSNAFNSSELLSTLDADEALQNYELLPWGTALMDRDDLAQHPTVLFLDRSQIVRSNSLLAFMQMMKLQHFKNCMVLFASTDLKADWSALAEPELGEQAWDPEFSHSDLRQAGAADLPEAINAIRTFLSGWRREDPFIGISYAHFDPNCGSKEEQSNADSDIVLLTELAETLRDRYGEHCILFDQFPSSKRFFSGAGSKKKSLEAYRQCDLSLILWNRSYKTSELCSEEKEVILQQAELGEADCIVLQGTDVSFREKFKDGTYGEKLTQDKSVLLKLIDDHLRQIQEKKVSRCPAPTACG